MVKSVNIVSVVAALWCHVGCNRPHEDPQKVDVKASEPTFADSATHIQNRINSFFYVVLVPKLQACWGRVHGKGELTFEYSYKKSETNWVWRAAQLSKSDLGEEEAAIALACMREASKGSLFPMEAGEAAHGADEFHLSWTWPVPFPPRSNDAG